MSTRTRIAATMVFAGVASLTLGLLSPSATAEPGGHTDCPAGTEKLVKFEAPSWNKEPLSVTAVTLVNPTMTGGSWTSTVPIAAVVVKGGSGPVELIVTTHSPAVSSGSYSNVGLLNNGGNVPEISHIEFCTPTITVTTGEVTTTTQASTTTTEASTTTTQASTTTTQASTTTTTAGATVGGVTESKDPAPVVAGVQELAQLPRTGSSADWLISLGVILLLTGVILMGATSGRVAWRSGS